MFQTTTWDVWGHAWIQMGMLAWYLRTSTMCDRVTAFFFLLDGNL